MAKLGDEEIDVVSRCSKATSESLLSHSPFSDHCKKTPDFQSSKRGLEMPHFEKRKKGSLAHVRGEGAEGGERGALKEHGKLEENFSCVSGAVKKKSAKRKLTYSPAKGPGKMHQEMKTEVKPELLKGGGCLDTYQREEILDESGRRPCGDPEIEGRGETMGDSDSCSVMGLGNGNEKISGRVAGGPEQAGEVKSLVECDESESINILRWEDDPVYRGMVYVGCEKQYGEDHFRRFLKRKALSGRRSLFK